ncbi:MAG: hypothetical protein AB7L66_07950 [Gemmatimonadales bacterium]
MRPFRTSQVVSLALVLFAARVAAQASPVSPPPGWVSRRLDNGQTGYAPPGTDGTKSSLMFLPAQATRLAREASHRSTFDAIARGSRVEGPVQTAQVGMWWTSEARLIAATGQSVWSALFTRTERGRLEGVMFVAATEAVFRAHVDEVRRMISGPETAAAPTAATADDRGQGQISITAAALLAPVSTAALTAPLTFPASETFGLCAAKGANAAASTMGVNSRVLMGFS